MSEYNRPYYPSGIGFIDKRPPRYEYPQYGYYKLNPYIEELHEQINELTKKLMS